MTERNAPARRSAQLSKPDPITAGRIVIERIAPEVNCGAVPAKRTEGDTIEVSADVFGDGHDVIAAEVLYRPPGERDWRRAPMTFQDNDRWSGRFVAPSIGRWHFTIEAWRDPFASWLKEVTAKVGAGQDVTLEAREGVEMARVAAARATGPDKTALAALVAELERLPAEGLLEPLLDPERAGLIERNGERANLSRFDGERAILVERTAARFSAWYELFPRSAGNDPDRHGTFDDVVARLPYVRDLGFDVLYFPPIHPIGEVNRKGRNNALKAAPGDVGSVYAIGSKDGGHDAIHPELGTMEDFRRLVVAAREHGLELALDFAIQCAPDHPWIREHPEWFDWRPDGSLKYAENPPKKYEDIVNVDFYKGGLPLWEALRDVILFWAEAGVRIFRVDNPHTKPLPFWRWMIAEVTQEYPDAFFLSEAFTRPKMMRALAKAGFQQSYTYFTWRNSKAELIEYMEELAHGEMADYYRPNFFVNTPDINPLYLQTSGRPGFVVRSTLAATLSSAWGIYSGFELCEADPLPGREEYVHSEKYELKARDFDRPGHIRDHIRALNVARRSNRVLRDFRDILFLNAWNDQILAYARITPERDNAVLVLVNLDPHNRQECDYEVPLWEFGLPDDGAIEAEDLLRGGRFTLTGKVHRIALDPQHNPVVVWRLLPPATRTPETRTEAS